MNNLFAPLKLNVNFFGECFISLSCSACTLCLTNHEEFGLLCGAYEQRVRLTRSDRI